MGRPSSPPPKIDHALKNKSLLTEKRNPDFDDSDSSSDFLTSAVVGVVTDSAILGGLLGGDVPGGIIGDLLDGDLFD